MKKVLSKIKKCLFILYYYLIFSFLLVKDGFFVICPIRIHDWLISLYTCRGYILGKKKNEYFFIKIGRKDVCLNNEVYINKQIYPNKSKYLLFAVYFSKNYRSKCVYVAYKYCKHKQLIDFQMGGGISKTNILLSIKNILDELCLLGMSHCDFNVHNLIVVNNDIYLIDYGSAILCSKQFLPCINEDIYEFNDSVNAIYLLTHYFGFSNDEVSFLYKKSFFKDKTKKICEIDDFWI